MTSPNPGYYYYQSTPQGQQQQQQPQSWSAQRPPPQPQPWPSDCYPSPYQGEQQPQAWYAQPPQLQPWPSNYPSTSQAQQQQQQQQQLQTWSAQRPQPRPWPSGSNSSSQSNQEILFTDEDADHLFNHTSSAPPPYHLAPLPVPIVIPRESAAFDAPFLRAYPPDAAASGINRDDWLAFLDGFNMAATTSPPLRVVNTVGLVLGFVPDHWFAIAGAGAQIVAQTASRPISKTLADRYLRRANETYFAPRGLRVRLAKTPAMRVLVGFDAVERPQKSGFMYGLGRAAETAALRLPIPFGKRIVEAVNDPLPPLPPGARAEDASLRRLSSLGSAVMRLDFNVPDPRPPEGLMDQFSALAVKMDKQKQQKANRKVDRNRRMLDIAQGRAEPQHINSNAPRQRRGSSSSSSSSSSSDSEDDKRRSSGRGRGDKQQRREEKRARREEKRARREEKGRDKRERKEQRRGEDKEARKDKRAEERAMRLRRRRSKSLEKLERRVTAANRLEYNATEDLVWVVVLTAEQDKLIHGRELVDNREDVDYLRPGEVDDDFEADQDGKTVGPPPAYSD